MTARDATRNPLTVALDTDDWATFERWCHELAAEVGVLKVGLESFVRWGHRAVDVAVRAAQSGGSEVFLDLKLHDIPNTVRGAVASARSLGVRYLTVHAGGGERMLSAARESAEDDLALLAVTVLTHLDATELERLDLPGPPEERVARWTEMSRSAGCAGVVCSPRELAGLRRDNPAPFLLVTPGIRPSSGPGVVGDDQRRTATPRSARDAGADLLVVGRPITRAPDPASAARELLAEL